MSNVNVTRIGQATWVNFCIYTNWSQILVCPIANIIQWSRIHGTPNNSKSDSDLTTNFHNLRVTQLLKCGELPVGASLTKNYPCATLICMRPIGHSLGFTGEPQIGPLKGRRQELHFGSPIRLDPKCNLHPKFESQIENKHRCPINFQRLELPPVIMESTTNRASVVQACSIMEHENNLQVGPKRFHQVGLSQGGVHHHQLIQSHKFIT